MIVRLTAAQARGLPGASTSKYNNRKFEFEGIIFDSAGEAGRYKELLLLERAGQVFDLKRQVPFALTVKGVTIGTYKADFVYRESKGGRRVVEDFKGYATKLYRWKKKHLLAEHGVEILETRAGK